jgi:hypothetical protein
VIVKAEGYAPLAKLVAVPETKHDEGSNTFKILFFSMKDF